MALNIFKSILGSLDHVKARSKIMSRADRELKTDLIQIRRKHRMTQSDVAEILGISQQAVNKFERYDSDPKLSTIRRYANAVGAFVTHEVTEDQGQSLDIAEASVWQAPKTRSFKQIHFYSLPRDENEVHPLRSGSWSEATRQDFQLTA